MLCSVMEGSDGPEWPPVGLTDKYGLCRPLSLLSIGLLVETVPSNIGSSQGAACDIVESWLHHSLVLLPNFPYRLETTRRTLNMMILTRLRRKAFLLHGTQKLQEHFARGMRGILKSKSHKRVAVLLLSWRKEGEDYLDVEEEV